MKKQVQTIPSFSLYGEANSELTAGLAHIETIAARSALHDWEIRPHRHNHNVQVLLVLKGQAVAEVDQETFTLNAPGFICLPQGTVHGFRFDPDTTGFVITLSAEFLTYTEAASDPLLTLLTGGARGRIPLTAQERIFWLANELQRLSEGWPQDSRLVRSLFESLLRSLPTEEVIPLDERVMEFRRLIELHLREHRPLSFYAQKVALSPRTLGRLCQVHLGCTPQQAINRRIAIEAMRILQYTNASVVQTSDALGFKDPSYFSRFYRRVTGRRPIEEKRATART